MILLWDRLRELAGIKENIVEKKEESEEEINEDDLNVNDLGEPPVDASSLVDPSEPLDPSLSLDPVGPVSDVSDDSLDDLPYPDFSTDLDSESFEEDKSEACNSICCSLDQVRELLGDVKLDEFKDILGKIESLASEVRSLGKSYLGESTGSGSV